VADIGEQFGVSHSTLYKHVGPEGEIRKLPSDSEPSGSEEDG
jgi:hypothetical protein